MTAEEGKTMCEAVIHEWNRRVRHRWPSAIVECPQCLAYMLLHSSRTTGDGLKVSYHIIYPWLVFPCNNSMLRDEIRDMSAMPAFQYFTQTGTQKPFIDPGVYTRNRQFRLLLNCKLPDRTRTALQLSQHPTLDLFVRSCITHIQERLPVLIQAVCFCPSGLCAPTLFKSSETKPALTRRRGGLPPRDNSYFRFAACTGTTVYKGLTVILSTLPAFFCQSPVASTCP